MIIESYSDLKYLEDNMVVDLSKLNMRIKKRVIDYLAGFAHYGELVKINKDKYLVRKEK